MSDLGTHCNVNLGKEKKIGYVLSTISVVVNSRLVAKFSIK